MDAAARRFGETKYPEIRKEIEQLSDQLAVLESARDRCRDMDVRTAKVYAALDYLAARASGPQWPFDAFRSALDIENPEGRWQNLNAAFNGVKLAVKE